QQKIAGWVNSKPAMVGQNKVGVDNCRWFIELTLPVSSVNPFVNPVCVRINYRFSLHVFSRENNTGISLTVEASPFACKYLSPTPA
ncbi:hypothetical protein, partial [Brevibacillus thermoruber]|uniref:hypothetical protein n=1 Tax=Brevibacillus thermoruber TaxID=33942 RepID=UPI001EE65CA5